MIGVKRNYNEKNSQQCRSISVGMKNLYQFRPFLLLILFISNQINYCDGFIPNRPGTIPTTTTTNSLIKIHIPSRKITPDLSKRIRKSLPSITRASESTVRLNALTSTLASTSVATSAATRGIASHFLVRILFLRGLGFVYLTAFLVALHQNKALIGHQGITPAHYALDDADKRAKSKWERREQWLIDRKNYTSNANNTLWGILKNTKWLVKLSQIKIFKPLLRLWYKQDRMGRPLISLLWFIPPDLRNTPKINQALDAIAYLGIALSSILFLKGAANVPILLGLWICQRSLMSVGGPWYGYGWEPQLAELNFHALFLVPLFSLNPIPPQTPVPKVAVWTMRWFLFRIMMGAGLIKIRSQDSKWDMKNLSTMDYFYETQPVPNPFSKMMHFMPKAWHKFEVLTNHFVELVAPWFLLVGPFLGRSWMIGAGILQIIFQTVLICSGNLR